MSHRLLEIPTERLSRWIVGFGQRHGPIQTQVHDSGFDLIAENARAELTIPWSPWQVPPLTDPQLLAQIAVRHSVRPRRLGVLLIRRGGWAVGVINENQLVVHKVGRRYVQGQTAAGGWSQQRYARRRANQSDALLADCIAAATTRLTGTFEGLIWGGDRALLVRALADPALAPVAASPRSPLLDIPDPSALVLKDCLMRGRCIRIQLDQP